MTTLMPIDVQSAFSWAPKVARKCESKHWYACGADGRSGGRSVYGHVITKFSRMGSLPHFVTHGAPLRASRARAPLIFIIQYIYNIAFLAPLVQKVNTLANQWMKFYPKDNILLAFLLLLIHWIVIYQLNSAIHL